MLQSQNRKCLDGVDYKVGGFFLLSSNKRRMLQIGSSVFSMAAFYRLNTAPPVSRNIPSVTIVSTRI